MQQIIRNDLPVGATDLYRANVSVPGSASFYNLTRDWATLRDMLVMYGGAACDQRVPDLSDYNAIMAGISNESLSRRSETGVMINNRTFYYNFQDVSNQTVQIGRVNQPAVPAGCYYVLIYNVSASPSDYSLTFSTTQGTTYSISGTVTGLPAGADATLNLSGAATQSTTTVSGAYSFTGLLAGNYTVTPSLSGYTFTPASRAVTISSADVSDQNFTGAVSSATYTISGSVKTSASAAISGVTITLGGAKAATATTDASGSYTFTGLSNGSYTMTAGEAGYTFSGWSGACTGINPTCLITVDSDKSVTAHFLIKGTTSFGDIPSGYWAWNYIEALLNNNITSGCGGGNYCPESLVTRGQMAVFVVKALGEQPAAACTGTVFNDVNANMNGGEGFCRYIEKFRELNITAGCAVDNPGTPQNEAAYCPDNNVTRAQMAIFLTKALGEQPSVTCTGTIFYDVNAWMNGGDAFCRHIEKFRELNITAGCAANNPNTPQNESAYCPDIDVTRAQMAVFLTKGFLQ